MDMALLFVSNLHKKKKNENKRRKKKENLLFSLNYSLILVA